eukprot:SAG31_NODE_26026_length_450_cov_0.680912_1_plen_120_part_01
MDRKELSAILKMLMGDQINSELLNALFQIVDADGDGNVSLAEFLDRLTGQRGNYRERKRRGSASTASTDGSLMAGIPLAERDPMKMPLSQLQAVLKKKHRRELRKVRQAQRRAAERLGSG